MIERHCVRLVDLVRKVCEVCLAIAGGRRVGSYHGEAAGRRMYLGWMPPLGLFTSLKQPEIANRSRMPSPR